MNKNDTIVTVTGIRPDFIRMSKIFKGLDENFNHILIHTGQHYDKMLSDVFFNELDIRKPDYNLEIGGPGKMHYHQSGELSVKLIEMLKEQSIDPKMIMFLGDSNSVTAAMSLKKEQYKIGHIEAGMRSGDKRMLEEINRTVCDHCSDRLFVYHNDYASNLYREGIYDGVHVVGNTIVEVCNQFLPELKTEEKGLCQILLDIHRPENFKYKHRMEAIIKYANKCIDEYRVPVLMLNFSRTMEYINTYGLDLGKIDVIDLMSYKNFLYRQYHALFIISDSGTGQEEPALLNTPVIVPRDFTERPQSEVYNCSHMLDLHNFEASFKWLEKQDPIDNRWLGDGTTSERIINILKGI